MPDRVSRQGSSSTPCSRRPGDSCPSPTVCRNAAWCRRPGVPWVRIRRPSVLSLGVMGMPGTVDAQTVEDLVELLDGEPLVIVAVHRHRRCVDAGSDAFLFLLQIDPAIRRALARLDAELVLAVAHQAF